MRDGMRHYISPDELDVVRRFVVDWEGLCDADHRILATLVRRFDEDVARQCAPEIREVRSLALQVYANDDLNIDEDAEILVVDEGYWVQSWTWVPKSE